MVKAPRRAVIALLALAAGSLPASVASASTINSLTSSTTPSSVVRLIDLWQPTQSPTDEAEPAVDEDCIVIDEARQAATRLGDARWQFGEWSWTWHTSRPSLVYVLCVDPDHDASGIGGGGMGLGTGVSWGGANAAARTPRPADAIAALLGGGVPSLEMFDEAPSIDRRDPRFVDVLPPMISTDSIDADLHTNAEGGSGQVGGGDIGAAAPPTGMPSLFSGTAATDQPLSPTPVPEPGAWMLMGTGLFAVWRARGSRSGPP